MRIFPGVSCPVAGDGNSVGSRFLGDRWPAAGDAAACWIQPEPGKIVLMPSYFHHRTVPLGVEQRRICVAFEIYPEDSPVLKNSESGIVSDRESVSQRLAGDVTGPGDCLFGLAGMSHRFVDIGPDFVTWVVFRGPKGGEAA